jgi:hypothetical protein
MAKEALVVLNVKEVQTTKVYSKNWTVLLWQPIARNWKKLEEPDPKQVSGACSTRT